MTDALPTAFSPVDLFDKGADPFSPVMLAQKPNAVTGPTGLRVFTLTIEGEPVPKLQGQILKLGKHMSIKKNPRTRAYEDVVRQRATHVWNGQPLIQDTPIEMTVKFYRPIPKSMSKRDQAAARAGMLRPITKPDNTNYVKAFEDGLNKVIFVDDALIVTSHIEKHFSDRPRVEVTLTW